MTGAAPSPWGADGDDTALARALHAGGVPLGALQRALADVRAARAGAGDVVSLAVALLTSGVVTPAQLEAARNHLAKTAVAASPGAPAALPSAFGPYRVVRELGRGGMGVVLEVEDAAGRRGALKTLLAGAEAELLLRFRREATLQARLDHPHVAPIHAAGLEESPPYLVQAFLTGGTLAERLSKRGPLPPAEVAALGRKLAAGLQHAHDRGVLHRDLKPGNVLFDDRGEPRIIDFGLARALDGASVRLTATGELLGTPSFIAPEVLTGAPVDARTDVHGLAALLYACLTGLPPHQARGEGLFATLNAALLHDPPRASTLQPDVPPWLDEALARGLARDPADRPPTAAALGAMFVGREVAAPSRRRRLGFASLLACALVLAGVGRVLRRDPSEGPAAPSVVQVAPDPVDRRWLASQRQAAAEASRLVADVVEGRRALPADPAGLAALAAQLRGSGVADLGTASATLIDLVGRDALARDRGARPAADEVLRAVRRLAPDRPCALTRAAAAALWSGVLAARAESDGGAERALAAAVVLAGPDAEVGGQVAALWRSQLEHDLPASVKGASDFVTACEDPTHPERARLLGIAEEIELVWRARPDTAPFVEPGLRLLYERLSQSLLRHVHGNRPGTWSHSNGELGAALRAAAPSDPLFRGMATILDPPAEAAPRLVEAMRQLEGLRRGSEDVEVIRSLVHNVLVALLVDRCAQAGLQHELADWLGASLQEWSCGDAVVEAFARVLVSLCEQDPARAPEARRQLEGLRDRSPDATARSLTGWIHKLPP